jgi:Ca-activated chloride channel homolog
VTGAKARLADELRQALTGDAYVADLATVGLRAPDGTADFEPIPGAPVNITTHEPDASVVNRAVGTWLSLTRPGRMLAVVDVSGSMNSRVPTANNQTRFQVLIEAAREGMQLFDDSWQVGLWTFSTNLDGPKDYLEVVPIRELTTNRQILLQTMDTLRPKPNGDTGLYDTVLAAYKRVQQDWDPTVVNSVVVMTDGQNDDDNGITLNELIANLETLIDARYPVQVICIGFGGEVSETELRAITDVTGGGTFIAPDPAAIGEIFLEALSVRPPAPTS